MNNKPFLFLFCCGLLLSAVSCKKYLEVGPPRSNLTGKTVFSSDNTAIAAMLSVYTQMEQSGMAYNVTIYAGTASDELNNHSSSATASAIANNNITPENSNINSLWSSLYNYIYQANSVLEGTASGQGLSDAVRRQLQGEAYFVRAFCHFYLLNFFGNIPYNTVTDYTVTSVQQQQNASQLLPEIISDLKLSKSLLSAAYVKADNTPGTERVRPNKYAAAAMLAKAYLFTKQWGLAEVEADSVLQQSMYALSMDLQQVFRSNSPEVIWQLRPVIPGFNSYAGALLQPTSFRPFFISVRKNLVDSFETGDNRKNSWVTFTTYNGQQYNWLHKYKVGQNAPSLTEFTTLIRLAELYLIRAEARAMQDKLVPALADLNVIRGRAGLTSLSLVTKEDILNAIVREKRVELFGEFADRWLDLVRTNRANTVMPLIKGANWSSTDQLFPIPQTEILRHPGMVQNTGY